MFNILGLLVGITGLLSATLGNNANASNCTFLGSSVEAVFAKAERFIRTQPSPDPESKGPEYPFAMLGGYSSVWKSVPEDIKPLFWKVSAIQSDLSLFATWVRSLERDFKTEPDFDPSIEPFVLTEEKFFEVLKKRLARLGWNKIVEARKFYATALEFYNSILRQQCPFVEIGWGQQSAHGSLSHLIQWTYIAESLEQFQKGSSFIFFNYLTSAGEVLLWTSAFDRGPGGNRLTNPGFVWALLANAFDHSFGNHVFVRFSFTTPSP